MPIDISFQLPKIGFIFFFFLACDSLCRLKGDQFLFPRNHLFLEVLKPSTTWWIWLSKWSMICFAIIALMSPVKEIPIRVQSNEILWILPPEAMNEKVYHEIELFMKAHPDEKIGLLGLNENTLKIPMTNDYKTFASMMKQIHPEKGKGVSKRMIQDMFSDKSIENNWVFCIAKNPKNWANSLPVGVHFRGIDPSLEWGNNHFKLEKIHEEHPQKQFIYLYAFPLFLSFLSMLAYLYGRNQKGLR